MKISKILSDICEHVTYHHTGNESLPPRETDGNETGTVGPLTCIESVLHRTKLAILSL
jgi:hypothetical protein